MVVECILFGASVATVAQSGTPVRGYAHGVMATVLATMCQFGLTVCGDEVKARKAAEACEAYFLQPHIRDLVPHQRVRKSAEVFANVLF